MRTLATMAAAAALTAAPAFADHHKSAEGAAWDEAAAEAWAADLMGAWMGETQSLNPETGEWEAGSETVTVSAADDALFMVEVAMADGESETYTVSYLDGGVKSVSADGEASESRVTAWETMDGGWKMVSKSSNEERDLKVTHTYDGAGMARMAKVKPAGSEEWMEVYKASYTPAE